MSDSILSFTLYITPQPYSEERLFGLCHELWRHGLRFTRSRDVMSWEDQLAAPQIQGYVSRDSHIQQLDGGSLQQAMAAIAVGDYGGLTVYDSYTPFFLNFNTQAAYNPLQAPTIGTISLTIDGAYALPDRLNSPTPEQSYSGFLLLPMAQVWTAFLHWSETLCTLISPLYGLGYNDDEIQDESFVSQGEIVVKAALQQGKSPDLQRWLEHGGVRYLAPQLFNDAQLLQLLRLPEVNVKRLASQGIFVAPPIRPFMYEYNEIYRPALFGYQPIGDNQLRLATEQEAIPKSPWEHRGNPLAEKHIERRKDMLRAIGDQRGVNYR